MSTEKRMRIKQIQIVGREITYIYLDVIYLLINKLTPIRLEAHYDLIEKEEAISHKIIKQKKLMHIDLQPWKNFINRHEWNRWRW